MRWLGHKAATKDTPPAPWMAHLCLRSAAVKARRSCRQLRSRRAALESGSAIAYVDSACRCNAGAWQYIEEPVFDLPAARAVASLFVRGYQSGSCHGKSIAACKFADMGGADFLHVEAILM